MKRALILSREFNPGDFISDYSKDIAIHLASSGMEVHIISFGERDEELKLSDRVTVHKVHFMLHADNFFNWVMLMNNELKRKGRELFEKVGFDGVYANDWTTAPAAISLSQLENVPLCVTIHSTERERGFNMPHSSMIADMEYDLATKTTKVFVESQRTLDSLVTDYKIPKEKIELIPREGQWQERIAQACGSVME